MIDDSIRVAGVPIGACFFPAIPLRFEDAEAGTGANRWMAELLDVALFGGWVLVQTEVAAGGFVAGELAQNSAVGRGTAWAIACRPTGIKLRIGRGYAEQQKRNADDRGSSELNHVKILSEDRTQIR